MTRQGFRRLSPPHPPPSPRPPLERRAPRPPHRYRPQRPPLRRPSRLSRAHTRILYYYISFIITAATTHNEWQVSAHIIMYVYCVYCRYIYIICIYVCVHDDITVLLNPASMSTLIKFFERWKIRTISSGRRKLVLIKLHGWLNIVKRVRVPIRTVYRMLSVHRYLYASYTWHYNNNNY